MKKLFLLTGSLVLTPSLCAFWPFRTSNPTQASQYFSHENRDALLKEINAVINKKDAAINERDKEIERLNGEGVATSLRHIDEIQQQDEEMQQLIELIKQKDAQIEQLTLQVGYFVSEYKKLCQNFMLYTHSSTFRRAFKVLQKSLKNIESQSEIPESIKTATAALNQAAADTLSPLEKNFKLLHQQELKESLIPFLKEIFYRDKNS